MAMVLPHEMMVTTRESTVLVMLLRRRIRIGCISADASIGRARAYEVRLDQIG
jgi:hypothetical protein